MTFSRLQFRSLFFEWIKIRHGHYNSLNKVEEPKEVVIRIDAADIPASFEEFFELELHELVEVELLEVVDYADTVNAAWELLVLVDVFPGFLVRGLVFFVCRNTETFLELLSFSLEDVALEVHLALSLLLCLAGSLYLCLIFKNAHWRLRPLFRLDSHPQ